MWCVQNRHCDSATTYLFFLRAWSPLRGRLPCQSIPKTVQQIFLDERASSSFDSAVRRTRAIIGLNAFLLM